MLSEQFDKKVKEAADNHHPSYDEGAWIRMEKLLNKHLPQKKDGRKRIVFILFVFLFLLLGGGSYLMIAKPWQHENSISHNNKNHRKNIPAGAEKYAGADNSEKTKSISSVDNNKFFNPVEGGLAKRRQKSSTDIIYDEENTADVAYMPVIKKNKVGKKTNDLSIPVKDHSNTGAKEDEIFQQRDKADDIISEPLKEAAKAFESTNTTEQKLNNDIPVDSIEKIGKEVPLKVAKRTKGNARKNNSLTFSLSAGPDISFAGLGKPGKAKLLIGAGVGYTFRNKLTLRTGFYSARKIYSAGPEQYHPPAYSWISYYDLKDVDADCKVFEIPVSLSYIFSHTAKQNWFGSAGLSSYIMKSESYDYIYKNSSGQLSTQNWTLKNKNKHYFSILTLSGGYERKINNTFSITAEPYLKIPVTGIGYGKVKLNSAGLLLSAGIRPFAQIHDKKK